ncbi:arginine--tRNA ligase [bacterium]|nr:arginine--tRNA ligase [bacterium]RQV97080.1 MAG: arginine--tRNA ligase [bacterium]
MQQSLLDAIKKSKFSTEDLPEIQIGPGKQKQHGDLSTNIAILLASKEKKHPQDVARVIVHHLNLDESKISQINVAGPGFINFTFHLDYVRGAVNEIIELGDRYGRDDWGNGKKTQVEFVSANPTGPLTIGHGRQAVLGDTIARLLEATHHEVTREYYFNDAGRQMRILGDSVRLRACELSGDKIEFPDDYYQGEYIRNIARQAIKEKKSQYARSEKHIPYFQSLAERVIFDDIKQTLSRLGIAFDVYYNEKSLYETGRVKRVIQELREKNLAYNRDGAVWFRTTHFGQEQDRVIVKSSGEPTYRLPDIAYHKDKMERGFDLVIDIFGADHIATYPDVLAGLEALGYDSSRVKVLIHQFVTLSEGKEKIKMSTRKANFVTLDELMDEVGVDATRYFFLNRSMSTHLNFDLSLAKTQSEENPVYYVQYAHARICSILRYGQQQGIDTESKTDLSLLKAPEEIDLMKTLMMFPDVVASAAREFEPHRIPTYLEEVATVYHRFQHAGKKDDTLRVVTEDVPLTLDRLALCRATRIVLANGLTLMGISKPEKM